MATEPSLPTSFQPDSILQLWIIEKKKFSMTFYNNKKKKDKPEITTFKKKPFTQVSYIPDFKRFNQSGLSEDMLTLMEKRAYDLAACSNDRLSIYFNDQKINCKSFEKYIDLFLGKEKKAYERVNNRWEVGCAFVAVADVRAGFICEWNQHIVRWKAR